MTNVAADANKRKPSKTFQDATPYLNDPQGLREKAEREGYLFFKGLVPRAVVLEVRRQILSILDKRGYLDRSYPLLDGVTDPDAIHRLSAEDVAWNGVGVPEDVYREVQQLEAFHALAHEPGLLKLYETLFGEAAFPHPRNIGRIMLPHQGLKATPSHQDFLHIQGAEQTWTCWMPLGDAPRELGSLSILEGSHNAGLLGVTDAPGAGGLESILCNLDYEWVAGDYEAGDLVTFHSLTVHKAMPNLLPNRVRLSADMRFQPVGQPIEPRSLVPHGPFEWSELYAGWTRSDLQYYWQDIQFKYRPFDESIRWQQEKIC